MRDAETGQPLAGVAVESYKLAGYPYSNHRVLKTTTDRQGRYRLTGMPKAKGNRLFVVPNDDQPYLMRRAEVPDPEGVGPVTVDIELHRGIWITGRVTDKSTGRPIHARVHYLPFRSNSFAQTLPEFDEHGNVEGDQQRYQTRPDGTFRLVGLPGRAIVAAQSVLRHYRVGVGADQIDCPKYRNTDFFDTYRNPINPGPKWPNVMKEIYPPSDANSVTVDFQMDPGQSLRITVVDPDDRPITGVSVHGLGSRGYVEAIQQPTFEAINLAPGETRTIVFHHEERNLGRVVRVGADEGGSKPITVRLQPNGRLKGRLLFPDGEPLTGAAIRIIVLPGGDFRKEPPSVTTDAQGRFESSVHVGSGYNLIAEGADIKYVASVAKDVSVEAGQTNDLGDIKIDTKRLANK